MMIYRQNAIEGVKELFACADIGNDECDITYMLENLPSADAVEVVRCGHCEWWKCNPNSEEYGVCNKVSYNDFEVVMNSDDFCSYGERKNK